MAFLYFRKKNFKANLIIEISENKGNIYLLKKEEDNKFFLLRNIKFFIKDNEIGISSNKIKKLLKNVLLENIIIIFSKDLAFSFLSRSTHLRDNQNYLITQSELERIILKLERQAYEKFRKPATWQIKGNIDNLELASAWVDKVFIDDHLVSNPIGFKGKSIGFLFGNTFLTSFRALKLKELLDKIRAEYERNNETERNINILVVEQETALIQFLSFFSIFRFIFLKTDIDETFLGYIDSFFSSSEIYYLNKGFLDLFVERISEFFQINESSAQKILFFYRNGKLDQNWQKKIKVLEKTAVKIYSDLIFYLYKKIPHWKLGPIEKLIFYSEEDLWFDLAREIRAIFKTKQSFNVKLKILNFNFNDLEKESGISLKFKENISKKDKIWLLAYASLFKIAEKKDLNVYLRRAIRRIK